MQKVLFLAVVAVAACTTNEPVKGYTNERSPALTEKQSDIMKAPDLRAAIALARQEMDDTSDKIAKGHVQLSRWAGKHLRWRDVEVSSDETSLALVRKDPDAARGKRMCVRGEVLEIQKVPSMKVFAGLLVTPDQDFISYAAAGSTGTIVDGDGGRLCGVVTGLYNFSNVSGGTTKSVTMVGMFELPENKEVQ